MQAQRIETFNKEQVRTKQMVARLNGISMAPNADISRAELSEMPVSHLN